MMAPLLVSLRPQLRGKKTFARPHAPEYMAGTNPGSLEAGLHLGLAALDSVNLHSACRESTLTLQSTPSRARGVGVLLPV